MGSPVLYAVLNLPGGITTSNLVVKLLPREEWSFGRQAAADGFDERNNGVEPLHLGFIKISRSGLHGLP
jgi:hypothetical protein